MTIQEQKHYLRKEMAQLKRRYTTEELCYFSTRALNLLEQTKLFQKSSCIALYYSIPGEIQTHTFLQKWYREKKLLLPVIIENELELHLYQGKEFLQPGQFNILEPSYCCPEISKKEVDCVIVPGIAFDRQYNRMGRGKGYYDRFLNTISAPKIGLCFHFQLIKKVPTDHFDIKMDYIVTDKEVI